MSESPFADRSLRFLYVLAVLATLPLAPFAVLGLFLGEGEEMGWFESMMYGLVFPLFLVALPVLLAASAVKWVATGEGLL